MLVVNVQWSGINRPGLWLNRTRGNLRITSKNKVSVIFWHSSYKPGQPGGDSWGNHGGIPRATTGRSVGNHGEFLGQPRGVPGATTG
ncbi:MAG: hypothetical protein ACK4ZH_05220, partial [Dolichospermum sp.]